MAETLLDRCVRPLSRLDTRKMPLRTYIPGPSSNQEFEIGPIGIDDCKEESISEEELDYSRTDEIYNLIVDNIKMVEAVAKIVMAIPSEGLFRIWTVVDKEDEMVRKRIYERERKVIESLSLFDVDVDFYVATEDMMDALADDEIMVIYSRSPVGQQV